ncbi:MAG: hypothetical protein RLO01_12655 [Thalassobaculaceae bacterium]
MTVAAIRTAIANLIRGVPAAGVVNDYERYTRREGDFRDLYQVGTQIRGWNIRRLSTREEVVDSQTTRLVIRWQVNGFLSLVDEQASELAFDDLIEAVRAPFRADETLGGLVETTFGAAGDEAGLQLDELGPVMFAGVLCHKARLSLTTRVLLDLEQTGIDDFLTGGITWDFPAPDGVTEAEDIIHPEQGE